MCRTPGRLERDAYKAAIRGGRVTSSPAHAKSCLAEILVRVFRLGYNIAFRGDRIGSPPLCPSPT